VVTRFAQGISYVLTPLVLPTAVLVLALINIGSQASDILAAGAIALTAFLLIPLADILWMIRRGKTTTIDVPERQSRTEVFALTIVTASAALLVNRTLVLPSSGLIDVILITYTVNLILVMGVNLFWKVSVHMVTLSGSLAILLIVSAISGETSTILEASSIRPFLLLIPLVGWARFRLKAHTAAQIVVGATLGFCGHWLVMLSLVG